MKRDKIKKLSILTFSPLSVVSTFAIISASCKPIEKVEAPQVVGIESSAPLSNPDVESQDITIKKEKTDNKSEGLKNSSKSERFATPPLLLKLQI